MYIVKFIFTVIVKVNDTKKCYPYKNLNYLGIK